MGAVDALLLVGSGLLLFAAAAVLAVPRGRGTRPPPKLLEVESGSNDSMAVSLVGLFMAQMGVVLLVGGLVGRVGVEANRRIDLDAAGL